MAGSIKHAVDSMCMMCLVLKKNWLDARSVYLMMTLLSPVVQRS